MDRLDRGLNKSRQQKTLLASSAFPEELSSGMFAYTRVPMMIIRLRA
ncbi:hypothetical protein I6N24_22450 [Escherichia coli]|jgi:hypothetical protein|uniref:Uncharacterized protein n=1 Tax=Escherichia marmotae TaxID=1499973 RepID=A0ABU1C800_9ESCH|nr:hypothetical protein [Escherichia coli]MCG3905808.1 hypothetical protein [Escherichia coli]MDQ9296751.1 hypothetical protein [Escherichia marmotae]CAH2860183.1 hypothetical protein SENBN9181_47650 [Salmonella enterica subsp. enterica serovar Typhimurium]HAN6040433.1 hypothetical protein [Escherichia coli]